MLDAALITAAAVIPLNSDFDFEQIPNSVVLSRTCFSLESISEMCTSNYFEKSVFSLFDGVKKVKCIKDFRLTDTGLKRYKERFDGSFFFCLAKRFS